MRWFRSKRVGPLFGAALLLLSMASAVLAEGTASINPLSNAPRGWETSTWWDTAGDSTATLVKFKAKCDDQYAGTSDANEWAKLQLLRFAGIFPWEDRGQITHTCGNVANVTWNWGAQAAPAEWFKWKLLNFSGSSNTLDVPDPGVYWQW